MPSNVDGNVLVTFAEGITYLCSVTAAYSLFVRKISELQS